MLTYPLVLLSKPVNPMNKVNAKVMLFVYISLIWMILMIMVCRVTG